MDQQISGEDLVLHALTPVGSEILTRKFEEMDQLISGEDQNQFYQIFYGMFDDQSAAMDVLLNGKELFAHQEYYDFLDEFMKVVKQNDGEKVLVQCALIWFLVPGIRDSG
ncbi:hypothetical protein KY290_007825 [Solanum tuberosum]|uniref:Uncharacterized protein n=1 Tax=Solanum tuberosum TaxID=4113 RepID=A0ABQ7W8M9_SOLTU|nr:hypothetical protein KY290_007825 [Solanum tuberosum]